MHICWRGIIWDWGLGYGDSRQLWRQRGPMNPRFQWFVGDELPGAYRNSGQADGGRPADYLYGSVLQAGVEGSRSQLQRRHALGCDAVGQVAQQRTPPLMTHLIADQLAHVDGP